MSNIHDFLLSHHNELHKGVIYENLSNLLKDGIRLGFITSMLPSEKDLVDILNISRITVRKALQKLEDEGLISRQKGRGTFIKQLAIYDISSNKSFKVSLTEQGYNVFEQRLNHQIISLPIELTNVFNDTTEVHYIKRLRYIDQAPVSIEELWIPTSLCPKDTIFQESIYQTLGTLDQTPCHFERKIYADLCNVNDRELLKIETQPVLILYQKGFTKENKLIEYAKITCRNEFYELREVW